MKRLTLATLALLLASAACNVGFPNAVRGSGNIVTQSFDVSGFDQIELDTIGDVHTEQGDSESLTIETDDNILPLLEVVVKDGKLILRAQDGADFAPSNTITFRVTVRELSAITANASGDFFVEPITGKSLAVHVNASGDVNLEGVKVEGFSVTSAGSGDVTVDSLEADDVQLQLSADGNATLAGETPSLNVAVNGSGSLHADDLQTSDAVIALRASGNATVWAADSLDITLSGSGDLSYYGNPKLRTNLTGSGDVTALGEK